MTVSAKNGATPLLDQNYGYHTGKSRLRQVDDGTQAARYDYEPNSPLVNTVTMGMVSGGSVSPRLTTVRDHDNWNRLRSMSVTPSGGASPGLGRGFSYDGANQRTRQTLGDGSYWSYEYDALGQLKVGSQRLKDGTPIAGRANEYDQDKWNRLTGVTSTPRGSTMPAPDVSGIARAPGSAGRAVRAPRGATPERRGETSRTGGSCYHLG